MERRAQTWLGDPIQPGISLNSNKVVNVVYRDGKEMPTGDGRVAHPDFTGDYAYFEENPVTGKSIEAWYNDIVFIEVKNSGRNLYNSSNNKQIEREVLALAYNAELNGYMAYRKENNQAPKISLIIMTTWDVNLVPYFSEHSQRKNRKFITS